jgi:phosphoribosylglycinamide formyltransferase-1
MYQIAVLISGAGSTLDNLAHHCYDEYDGMLKGFVEITRVVADRECKGLEVAEKWGLPKVVIKATDYPDKVAWSEALFDAEVNLHVLGGFLSQVVVPLRWEGKIVNIHPSLLPAYGGKGMYGIKVHEAVIAAKEKVTGCTVHTVTDVYDDGMILGQIKQAVLPWDDAESLQQAVQKMEQKLYPRTILNFSSISGKKNPSHN